MLGKLCLYRDEFGLNFNDRGNCRKRSTSCHKNLEMLSANAEVKLTKLCLQKPARIWPLESLIKNYKQVTKSLENLTVSLYFWLKSALLFRFSFTLTFYFLLTFYFYIEKQQKKNGKKYFSDIPKVTIWCYLKKPYTLNIGKLRVSCREVFRI